MFATAYWTVVGILLIGAVFAAMKLFESHGLVISDLALFTLPFILWVMLTIAGVRSKSLANLIEPVMLVPIVLLAFLIRSFAFERQSHAFRSSWAASLCVVAALLLYSFVPVLDE